MIDGLLILAACLLVEAGRGVQDRNADLDTLLTALNVEVDDHVLVPRRRRGRPPRLSDAELVCLAVAQVLLNFPSERHWLRYARRHLGRMFPYLPDQDGYNRRMRKCGPLLAATIRHLAFNVPTWWDELRLLDSTLVLAGDGQAQ